MKKLVLFCIVALSLVLFLVYFQQKNETIVLVSNKVITDSSSSSSLKIMTYNIKHGIGLDNKLDLKRIVTIISDSDAEIIGLNEVDKTIFRSGFQDQVKILAENLNMNYAFGPTVNKGIGSFGNAILSKYPIVAADNFLLPGDISDERRGLLVTKVLLPFQNVYIITTHLSLDKVEREEQLRWIEEYLTRLDYPFILMGDFNTELDIDFNFSPLLKGIKSYPSNTAREEIDLFFSNMSLQLIDGYSIASTASDHLPIVIEIKSPE